jgi:hypothetical protein
MERETGIEPATNSLEEWSQIVNKQQWRLQRSFQTIKNSRKTVCPVQFWLIGVLMA